jgi:hypothetical protein
LASKPVFVIKSMDFSLGKMFMNTWIKLIVSKSVEQIKWQIFLALCTSMFLLLLLCFISCCQLSTQQRAAQLANS